MRVQPLILAAGKGTRMGDPDRPKMLIMLGERPLVGYVLNTLKQTNFFNATIVIGFKAQDVEAELGEGYRYIFQAEQLGTGHAVRVCADALHDVADTILVLYGDQPLISAESMKSLVEKHDATCAVLTVLTARSDEEYFQHFGRILRNEHGQIQAIREYKDATEKERAINEFNTGIYAFDALWLWKNLPNLTKHNAQSEYYLTDLIAMAVEQGKTVSSMELPDWHEALGVNTPEQLKAVEAVLGL
jgi:bifunctional UDP-N-acetylglucosamine pyrophosphorylase/glucosamine-1-phosphate N-acetyltransferase